MEAIKLQIKSRRTGNILFEYESEDNIIKKTVEQAVSGGADLGGANLYGADLRYADLGGADLGGADLRDGIKLRKGNSIFRVSDIGSRMGTTFVYDTDKGIYVQCGCFFGTLGEFAQAVEKTHGDNKHGKAYKAMIELIKIRFSE